MWFPGVCQAILVDNPWYKKYVSYFKYFKDSFPAKYCLLWHVNCSDLWGHRIFYNSSLVCDTVLQGELDSSWSITCQNVEGHLRILNSGFHFFLWRMSAHLSKGQTMFHGQDRPTCELPPFIPGGLVSNGIAHHL